jgi:hypothetical protein
MAVNLTTQAGSPAFAAGKFGNAFAPTGPERLGNTGVVFPATGTVEAWLKTSATGTTVFISDGTNWMGQYNSFAGVGLPSGAGGSIAINDGLWHHFAYTWNNSGTGKLWVDGVQAASFGASAGSMGNAGAAMVSLGGLGAGFGWTGGIDEVRISNTMRYTTAFTPPTTAFTDDANTLYLYHLEANGNDSHSSADTTPPTVPGTPTAVAGNASATVTFTASTDDTAVTGYEVYSSADGYTAVAASGSASPITVTGLTNGTAYTFKVRAGDAAGNHSAQSAASNSVTPTTGTTVPGAPTGLGAVAGSAQVALSWTAPASNGGATITDYVVQYRTTAGPGSWNTFADGTSTATTATVTGLTNGTGYDFQVAAVNSVGTGAYSSTASATPTPVIAPNDTNIVYSPYTWAVSSTQAKTINSGAYFRTVIQGNPTAVTLNFDLTGVSTPVPQITVLVDGISLFSAPVATTVGVTLPSGPTWQKRMLEVVVKSTTETATRWSPQNTAVKFTGITTTPNTCTTVAVQTLPLRGLIYGDSITEGVRTINATATNDTDRNDATVTWSYALGDLLGAEVGVVGFGGSDWTFLASTYNFLWSGQARSFTPAPDFIVCNHGYNDGANNITANVTTVLNGLIAATPSTTKILLLRPFGLDKLAQLTAAKAACTAPTRVTVVDSTGWFNTADASDGIHPYGYTNVTNLGPRVAAAVRAVLPGSGGSGSRYVNVGGVAKAIGTVIKA